MTQLCVGSWKRSWNYRFHSIQRKAPLARAVLLHEANQAVVILVAHHSFADGRSIAFVIRDLMRALAGDDIDTLPPLPSQEEILGVTRAGAIQSLQQPDAATAARPAAYTRKENSRPRIKGVRLGSALTSKLREAGVLKTTLISMRSKGRQRSQIKSGKTSSTISTIPDLS